MARKASKATNKARAVSAARRSSSSSGSSVSMALTSTTTTNTTATASASAAAGRSSMDFQHGPTTTARSSDEINLMSPTGQFDAVSNHAQRKRARAVGSARRSGSASSTELTSDSTLKNENTSLHRPAAVQARSPSANAITASGKKHADSVPQRPSTGSRSSPSHDSPPHQQQPLLRRRSTAAPYLTRLHQDDGFDEDEELFFEAPSPTTRGSRGEVPTPLRHLQDTPTSQLLSQLQDPPYTADSASSSEKKKNFSAVQDGAAAALFTPVTVARRRVPPAVAAAAAESSEADDGVVDSLTRPSRRARGEGSGSVASASASASASRDSVHDAAVQAILRANPPTTTRAVELKPGYHAPSPRSPLWAALDAEEDNESLLLLTNTQVSLFQEDEEASARPSAGRVAAAAAAENAVPVLAATQERRRLDTRHYTLDGRISLPAPGRSVNLLDEEGLHEDERLPLFVETRDSTSRDRVMNGDDDTPEGSQFISLTQEAAKQERAQDHQAVLPRSRNRRSAATAQNLTTPSPSRRTRLSASQQASPFSQLQRDVAHATAAAAAAAVDGTHAAAGVATSRSSVSPLSMKHPQPSSPPLLSQRELRRRADMLKWAERTRAFFHFIDSLPLQITNSPSKSSPTAATKNQEQRRSRSQTIATTAASREGRGSTSTTAASVSLVRRSRSAVAPVAVTRQGSTAFEAAVSRVKREAAAAAATKQQSQRRSTTLLSRPSAQ